MSVILYMIDIYVSRTETRDKVAAIAINSRKKRHSGKC